MKRREFNALVALGAASSMGALALERTTTLVVTTTTATASDIVARLVQPHLSQRLKRTYVVENKTGASGIIGMQAVAKAQPDGSIAMIAPNTLLTITPMNKNLPFSVKNDFTPVTPLASSTMAVIVSNASGFNSLNDFVEAAKARPGQINYGSPGVGTPHHLLMEVFLTKQDLKVTHIPFKGSAPMVNDIAGGRIDIAYLPLHTSVDLARSGRLKVIAIGNDKRSPLFPDVRTIAEQGFQYDGFSWSCGFFLPPHAPAAMVSEYEQALFDILKMPSMAESLARSGLTPRVEPSAEFARRIRGEVDQWIKVAEAAGIRPE